MSEPIWINERLERISQHIEDYALDMSHDRYHEGYDIGYRDGENHTWDQARNKGYDEGWEDACQYILDKFITKDDRWSLVNAITELKVDK